MVMRIFYQFVASLVMARAAVKFTYPEAGTTVILPALQGPEEGNRTRSFPVAWADDIFEPSMYELGWYTLHLMFGGNDISNSQEVSVHQSEDTLGGATFTGSITVEPAALEAIEDGFYNQMVAKADPNRKYTGTIIFYSTRFSIEGLWGHAAPEYAQAAIDGRKYRGPEVKSCLNPPLPTNSPYSTRGVLSNEAKGKWIGGSVGVVLALLATALGLYVAWQKKRKAKAKAELHPGEHELPGDEKGRLEMGAESSGKATGTAERRAELATDWTGWEAPALLEVEISRPSMPQRGT